METEIYKYTYFFIIGNIYQTETEVFIIGNSELLSVIKILQIYMPMPFS